MMQSGSPFLTDNFDLIQQNLWEFQNSLFICSIGKVTAVTDKTVSIQPLVNYFDKNNGFLEMPVIEEVRVAQFFMKSASVLSPIVVGDTGIILWFDREIETALKNGSPTKPMSGSMSNASACVFLPFLSKDAPALLQEADGLKLDSKSKVSITSAEDFTVASQGKASVSSTGDLTVVSQGKTSIGAAGNLALSTQAKLSSQAAAGTDFTSAGVSLLSVLQQMVADASQFATVAAAVTTPGQLPQLAAAAAVWKAFLTTTSTALTTFKG